MAGFQVDPDELGHDAAAVATRCAQARAAVGRIRAGADALFGDGWHGPAAAAFRTGWEHWLAGAGEMLDALDGLARLLAAAGAGYAEAEAGVRAAVNGTPA